MKKYIFCFQIVSCTTAYGIFDYDLAILQSQKGNWPEATQRLKKVLADQPDNADILYDSGVSAYKNKEFDKALAYFNKTAEIPNTPQALREQAYFNAGNAHVSLKQLHEAIDAYDRVLALNPEHEKAKHNKEVVKKMLEQQKKEQEQKEKENKEDQKNDKNEQNQDKNQEQKDSDQQEKERSQEKKDTQSADAKAKADKQESEEKKKERENQNKQEQKKKESSAQEEKQQSADAKDKLDRQQNESTQKLSAALEHALKEREKKDAQLNKKMIKAMAASQNGGKNDINSW